jgi:hypothetical protein
MPNQKHITLILRLNLALAFAVGLLVLWAYLQEPSEPSSAVLFGFSYLRLTLLGVVFFLLMGILILLLGSLRNRWNIQREELLKRLAYQKGIFWIALLWIASSYILLFLSEQRLGSLASYRERLLPILVWLAVLSVQFTLFLFYARGVDLGRFQEYRSVLLSALVVLALFSLLLLVIKLTGIGLTRDAVYWQGPGTPILLHQVLFATLVAILFYLFIESTHLARSTRLDLIVFLGLWAFASFLWLSQPAKLTHFSLEPAPPNYQSYPFSDALLYDNTAWGFLAGESIPSDFWTKPFYSFFLAMLHLFVGGNYTLLIALQVIFLAMIPAFTYLLMVRLNTRPAGVIVALLLTLRERNALMLSDVIQVSHVKLVLSDVFAMACMVLLLWLFYHWLEKPAERRVAPLLLGGIFSLLVLTRGHPILLLPFILLAVFIVRFPHPRLRWEAVTLTLLGFLLPLLPWLWRNYELTGKLAFQYPVSPYSAQMSTSYSMEPSAFDPLNLPPRFSGESDIAYYDRLQGSAMRFVLEHPDEVAKFVSSHYFHNLIFSYIYLPHSLRIDDVREYVKTAPFWSDWRGNLSVEGRVLLFTNLVVIALGLGYLWKTHKYFALVPLFLGIGYNLSVSIGRVSGWRFILPVDWITLIYYATGLIQLFHLLRSFTHQEQRFPFQEYKLQHTLQPLKRLALAGFVLFFLLIGVVLTRGQGLFSQRYPVKSMSQLKEEYKKITNTIPSLGANPSLDNFLETDDAIIIHGQASNPTFLKADKEGLNEIWPVYYFWPSYKPRPFSRLIFNLNGPQSAGVVLPMETAPFSFPDGADVIVIGCWAESGEINAGSVLIMGDSPIHYNSKPPLAATCASSQTHE